MKAQKHRMYSTYYARGFGLLETLISFGIIAASLVTLTATNQFSFKVVKNSLEKTQANFLAGEGLEVVRILRDTSWSTYIAPLATSTGYYPSFDTAASAWTLATGTPPLVDGIFKRTLTVADVYRRNSDSQIVSSSSPDAKALDPDTKEMTFSVSWDAGGGITREVRTGTYITDLFQN